MEGEGDHTSCIRWERLEEIMYLCSWEDYATVSFASWPDDYKWSNEDIAIGYNCLDIQRNGNDQNEQVSWQDFRWRFEYEIEDMSDDSWMLKVDSIGSTTSSTEYPCCLPGLELDSDVPHGPCKLNSTCLCDDSICE